MIHEYFLSFELVQAEGLIGLARGQYESVVFVDLGKMDQRRSFAALECAEVGRYSRLCHLNAASVDPCEHVPGCLGDGEFGVDSFGCQITPADRDQQRGIEGRVAGDHNVALAHGVSPVWTWPPVGDPHGA